MRQDWRSNFIYMGGPHRFGDTDDLVNSNVTESGIDGVGWESKDCAVNGISR